MIVNANSVHIPLDDQTVHCVVTSPPYWGLRKYEGEQDNIWGGDADCGHEWKMVHPAGYRKSDTKPGKLQSVGNSHREELFSNTCQRCGAWRGGLGLEPTPEMFIDHMVQIFQEVKRVLRADGVAWVNMGDSYHSQNNSWGESKTNFQDPKRGKHTSTYSGGIQHNKPRTNTLKQKDLVLIPHRLALALQADGWWVRSDVIWAKPNPMPESLKGWRWEQCKTKVAKSEHATVHNIKGGHKKMLEDASVHQGMSPDFLAVYENCTGCDKCKDNDGLVLRRGSWRPTSSYEHLFMLAKSSMYYSDGEAVRERHNLRNVWNINTKPYKGAHYATFPPELARRCVLSSTSRHACSECGMAWTRVMETQRLTRKELPINDPRYRPNDYKSEYANINGKADAGYTTSTTISHRPSCQCNAGTKPCLVLDPFAGSGTVGQVCRELPYQRDFVGVDISYEYLHGQALLRSERITTEASLQELPMFADDNGGRQ